MHSTTSNMFTPGQFFQRLLSFTVLFALLNGSLFGPILHSHNSCCSGQQAPTADTESASNCACHFHLEARVSDARTCPTDKTTGDHSKGGDETPPEHDQNCGICFVLAQFAVTSFESHFEFRSEPAATIVLLSESCTETITPSVSARGPPVI